MKRITVLALGALPLLAGACASVPPQHAYYVVPCDTPGAILTGGAAAPAPQTSANPVCIVAAATAPPYASSRYYPVRRGSDGYYGRRFLGTLSHHHHLGSGSHRVGHHGGGHGGGGHGGGHGGRH